MAAMVNPDLSEGIHDRPLIYGLARCPMTMRQDPLTGQRVVRDYPSGRSRTRVRIWLADCSMPG